MAADNDKRYLCGREFVRAPHGGHLPCACLACKRVDVLEGDLRRSHESFQRVDAEREVLESYVAVTTPDRIVEALAAALTAGVSGTMTDTHAHRMTLASSLLYRLKMLQSAGHLPSDWILPGGNVFDDFNDEEMTVTLNDAHNAISTQIGLPA